MTSFSAGCGTIMYPERKGQPAGDIDWQVAGLNTLGLMFFFVPGVIAFAVDFNNGTIYLPQDSYGASETKADDEHLALISIPTNRLSKHEIGIIVSNHAGQEVKLASGQYETQPLDSIDNFWTLSDQMNVQS